MPTILLVFEFLGTTELLVIALVALIIFGPRKLPEIGRKIGRGMAEFKRASEDFKRTWEYEVEVESKQINTDSRVEHETEAARTSLLADGSQSTSVEEFSSIGAPQAITPDEHTVARTTPGATPPEAQNATTSAEEAEMTKQESGVRSQESEV